MKPECHESIQRITKSHSQFLERNKMHKAVKELRRLGTILALELKTHQGTSYFSELRKKIYPFFLERNILLRPLGNVIYVLPPYVITDDELKKVYAVITEFLDTL